MCWKLLPPPEPPLLPAAPSLDLRQASPGSPPRAATPAGTAPDAAPDTSPITEHVHLDHVGENTLEEGERATSEPGTGGRKKWVPKQKG